MDLGELLEQDLEKGLIVIPRREEYAPKKRAKFADWLLQKADEIIKQNGAFLKTYELKRLNRTIHREIGYQLPENTYCNTQAFTKKQKHKKSKIKTLLKDVTRMPLIVKPINTGNGYVWYYDKREAIKYLKNIISVKFAGNGNIIARLIEPYKSVVEENGVYVI